MLRSFGRVLCNEPVGDVVEAWSEAPDLRSEDSTGWSPPTGCRGEEAQEGTDRLVARLGFGTRPSRFVGGCRWNFSPRVSKHSPSRGLTQRDVEMLLPSVTCLTSTRKTMNVRWVFAEASVVFRRQDCQRC